MNRKNMIRGGLVTVIALLIAAVPLLAACAPKEETVVPPEEQEEAAPPEEEKLVNVGISFSLTGPLSATSIPIIEGTLSYFDMINEEGGVAYKDPASGKTMHAKIDAMWADDGYKMDNIISNYTRFKDAGAILFLHCSAGADIALGDTARNDKLPLLHSAMLQCAYPKWPGDPPSNPPSWIVSTPPDYADTFAAFVDWVMDNWTEDRPPRLGFITVDNPFGTRIISETSLAYMEEKGMDYVGVEFYQPTDVDVMSQLRALDDKGADWVFHNYVWEGFCTVLKSASDLGLKDHMKFCSNIYFFNRRIADVVGQEVADGSYGLSFYADLDSDLPGVKLMKDQILKRYPDSDLDEQHFTGFWLYGFGTVQGIKAALEQVGYPITGEDYMNGIFSADGKGMWADTGGAIPPLDYNSNPKDATAIHKVRILQFQDGKQVTLTEDWLDTVPLSVEEYYEYYAK